MSEICIKIISCTIHNNLHILYIITSKPSMDKRRIWIEGEKCINFMVAEEKKKKGKHKKYRSKS